LSQKLRFGVIGAGNFAEVCHIPGLQSHPQAEVVALCGCRREHAAAMAQRLEVPDVHTDYQKLIARDDIDGVAIVTPNVSHAEIAIAALHAGAIGMPHYIRIRGEGMGGLSPNSKAAWREVMSLSGGEMIQES
jgi:predicted dehydrogenase